MYKIYLLSLLLTPTIGQSSLLNFENNQGHNFMPSCAKECSRSLFAPPSAWSPAYQLTSHGGKVAYSISIEPIGDTQVRGRVKYWISEDEQIEKEFYDSVTFQTANVWGNIELQLKGEPLGSATRVTFTPC